MEINELYIQIFLIIMGVLGSILTIAISTSVWFIYTLSKSVERLNVKIAVVINKIVNIEDRLEKVENNKT